jgi:hypothetical protein
LAARKDTTHAVYFERGTKRTFAAAIDWPGWCRQGPSETDALTALLAYGPKYAGILAGTRLGFVPPKDLSQVVVVRAEAPGGRRGISSGGWRGM